MNRLCGTMAAPPCWTPTPPRSTEVRITRLAYPQPLDCDLVPASGRAVKIQGPHSYQDLVQRPRAIGVAQFPINGLRLDGSRPSDLAREFPRTPESSIAIYRGRECSARSPVQPQRPSYKYPSFPLILPHSTSPNDKPAMQYQLGALATCVAVIVYAILRRHKRLSAIRDVRGPVNPSWIFGMSPGVNPDPITSP